MAEETENQSQGQQINLDELTPQQALEFITNTTRQLSFSYAEHVNLEQCRRTVEQAIA